MTLTCPDHRRVTPRLACCLSADGRLHLGGRCPKCNLWLRWLPKDTPCLPSVTVEALR